MDIIEFRGKSPDNYRTLQNAVFHRDMYYWFTGMYTRTVQNFGFIN